MSRSTVDQFLFINQSEYKTFNSPVTAYKAFVQNMIGLTLPVNLYL